MPVTIGGGLSFCGRELQPQELDLIRQITRDFSTLSLTELAHTVCELLEWRRPNGGLKGRECFLFLQALHQRGWLPWLSLPPKKPRPRAAVWDQLSDAQAAPGLHGNRDAVHDALHAGRRARLPGAQPRPARQVLCAAAIAADLQAAPDRK